VREPVEALVISPKWDTVLRRPAGELSRSGAPDTGSDCPWAARSAAAYRYDARCDGASGTPRHPGMLHMSTTYGFPALSMMSTL